MRHYQVVKDPSKRMTLEEFLVDPWVTGENEVCYMMLC
jgi:hypothetical protein